MFRTMNVQKKHVLQQIQKLPKEIREIIFLVRDCARARNVGVYVVGGFVRDLLLGENNFDLDIVVEQAGIDFAHALAQQLDASLVKHRAFNTATITKKDGMKIDIATSRREYYSSPAVLPRIMRGSIDDDLLRRDCSINALACHIDYQRFGELVDKCNGIEDLKKKRIRFLHEKSFIDDPTRIIRAIRFEQRFGFSIENKTRRYIAEARNKKMLEQVQKHRLRDELILIFKEPDPYNVLKRLHALYNITFLDSHLKVDVSLRKSFAAIKKAHEWFEKTFTHRRRLELWFMYLALFLSLLSERRLRSFAAAYAFRRTEILRMVSFRRVCASVENELARKKISLFTLHCLLDPLSYEVMVLVYALSRKKIVRERVCEFLTEHHHKKLTITGKELLSLGLRPGPKFSVILRKVFQQKIEGTICNHQQELALAKKLIQQL